MGAIRLEHVSKRFDDTVVVDDVSLDIADGEFVVLVGPSGCGKTTLLRMLAGLEDVTEGKVMIGGDDATDLSPRDRDIAMVFQNYALYPHMTVAQNLAFGLEVRGMRKAEAAERVERVAKTLRLEALLNRKPRALSGGQRQRVAMGRAMVREPSAYLMDEPLSNLDAKLRVAMRTELSRLHERLGVTTIYVTHDQVEAMTLGDRVVVMRDGILQQVDTPQALFHEPANLFVAGFIGSPSINLAEATFDGSHLCFGGHRLPVPEHYGLSDGEEVLLGIRPNDFARAEAADAALPRMNVRVEVVENLGVEAHVVFAVDTPPIEAEHFGAAAGEDDEARLLAGNEGQSLFIAALDAAPDLASTQDLTLAVNHLNMHLFDRQTGRALPKAAVSTLASPH
jgi:multiple sugar transport system ATP-binding protein